MGVTLVKGNLCYIAQKKRPSTLVKFRIDAG
jgi:hypothetical protein